MEWAAAVDSAAVAAADSDNVSIPTNSYEGESPNEKRKLASAGFFHFVPDSSAIPKKARISRDLRSPFLQWMVGCAP